MFLMKTLLVLRDLPPFRGEGGQKIRTNEKQGAKKSMVAMNTYSHLILPAASSTFIELASISSVSVLT